MMASVLESMKAPAPASTEASGKKLKIQEK
jgi:hypothetical protein